MRLHHQTSSPTIGLVLLLLCSCTSDMPDTNQPSPDDRSIRVTASVNGGQEAKTRVTDNTSLASAFESGDEIGVYVVSYDRLSENVFTPGTLKVYRNQADNVKHTIAINGSNTWWTPEKPEAMLWTDAKTPIDLFAYSPFSETVSDGAEQMTNIPFEVFANQSGNNGLTGTANRSNYQQSDLMWAQIRNATKTNGVGTSSDPLDLKFSHLLSKISIEVTLNDEFLPPPADRPYQVQIIGTFAQSNVNFTTGEVAVVSNPTDFNPIVPTNEQVAAGVSYHYLHKAILIPQVVKKRTNLLLFTSGAGKDTKVFLYQVDKDVEFKPNTHYLYQIIVGRYGITVKTSIIPWDQGGITADIPERLATFCNIIMKEEDFKEGAKSLWTWQEASVDKLIIGYHLPTSDEIKQIWPTSDEAKFNKNGMTAKEKYFCDATHQVIYGIKQDASNNKYWMRWEYQGIGADAKLKLSYWKSGGPDDFTSVITKAGGSTISQENQYKAVRNAYPIARPEILYLSSTETGAVAGKGIYWVQDGNGGVAKTISFDATGVTQPTEVNPVLGTEMYAVRYFQNTY